MKKLRESLQGKSADQLKDEDSRIKVTALRTTSNINSLIRDLFRNPPSFKATVTLSFKPPATQVTCNVVQSPTIVFNAVFCRLLGLRQETPKKQITKLRPVLNATHPSHLKVPHPKPETMTIETQDSSTLCRLVNSAQTSIQMVSLLALATVERPEL